jgi:flavin-dependent dehydrogenase
VPRIKGVHTAIASGIQAAEVVFDALQKDDGLAREAEERRRQKAAAPAEKGEVGREEELFSGDEEEAGEGDEDLSKPYVRPSLDLSDYDRVLRESWVGRELEEARNIRPG